MSKISDRVCQHLCQVGLHPRESARFASQIQKWVKQSGPEWTVSRLKSLSDYYKARLVNRSAPLPEGWATKRNSRNKKKVLADGFIHRTLSSFEGAGLKKAQALIRSYQIITLKEVSSKQMDKFVSAVSAKQPTPSKLVTDVERTITSGYVLHRFQDNGFLKGTELVPLSHWSMPSEKRSPVIKFDYKNRPVKIQSVPRSNIKSKSIELLLHDRDFNELWQTYGPEVSECLTGSPDHLVCFSRIHDMDQDRNIPVGSIGFIQEGGAKLRSVANPLLVVQALGEPLKLKLAQVCKDHKSCYVFNQGEALSLIHTWLGSGETVWGFDSTSFTDSFPYSIQRSVLLLLFKRGIVSEFDISVFDTVISKSWKIGRQNDDGTYPCIRWQSGQPMGFGPSFFLATVAHVACLEALCYLKGIGDSGNQFAIVGDDIVIRNGELAAAYHELMTDLGVSINMEKSMASSDYAEFCGKIVSKKHGVSPSIKTKLYKSAEQIEDSLKFYGKRGYSYLSPKERLLAIRVFLPEAYGGLGFKPDGMAYGEYLKILDMDAIQSKLLLDEVKRFYRDVSTYRAIKASLTQIKSFYDHLDKMFPLSLTEWCIVETRFMEREFHGISEWTGLPIHFGRDSRCFENHESTDFSTQGSRIDVALNSFRETFDLFARGILSGKKSKTAGHIEIYSRILDMSSGYVHNSEKPPLRPIASISEDPSDGKRTKENRSFFSRDFTPT